MKRIVICIAAMLFLLCGCGMSQTELQANNFIPADGIISAEQLKQLSASNGIAVFRGENNGFSYEWTVFGREISDPQPVDLRIQVSVAEESAEICFMQPQTLGFPAMLSVHMNEKWSAQSATVYREDLPVGTASLTGSAKETILNFTVEQTAGGVRILPDAEPQEPVLDNGMTDVPAYSVPAVDESYLSQIQTESTQVYGENNTSQPVLSTPTLGNDSYLTGTSGSDGTVYAEKPVQTPVVMQPSTNEDKTYLSGAQTGSDQIYGGLLQNAPAVAESQKPQDETYLSGVQNSTGRVYSDGSMTEQDIYFTDPVPVGKPMPVEPENRDVDKSAIYTCVFSIECSTILNNLEQLDADKLELVPSNGVILQTCRVTFYEGESVFDVLQRVCKEKGIHMESEWTPIYNSAYVEGIHNLYEFDCGALSGWMYKVNGWYPNYGCSRYQLKDGDVVEWRFTCDLGNDIGGGYAVGG